MMMRDGSGRVVRCWGGYVPKLYDEHFIEAHKEEISEKFQGAIIIADNHFTYGAKFLEGVRILTSQSAERKSPIVPLSDEQRTIEEEYEMKVSGDEEMLQQLSARQCML